MTTKFSIALLSLWFSALSVQAGIINAASASFTDVSAAVAMAARGDTVVVPAGSSTWTSALSLTKGIKLVGAGRDSTAVTGSGVLIAIAPDATAIANEEVIRVEGFTFDGNNSAVNIITVQGAGPTSSKPFKNLVIGNNRLRNTTNVTAYCGAVKANGQVRGVIFSNIFDRCNVILKIMGNDDPTEWSNGNFPFAYGNSDNLFFEHNTIQWSSGGSWQDPGWTETGQGARLCMRYNTFDFTHVTGTELQDIHGFQYWPGGQTGTMVSEYYGNTYLNTSGYRFLNLRGGWGLIFNNIVTGSIGGMQASQYINSCPSDLPGSSGVYETRINNSYVFNNSFNGTIGNMTLNTAEAYCGISENSNWWNYNSSFNGTTGIGRGTTAPTGSCSVGVAYWNASTPTPTTDPNVIQNGTLYKCLSANVWTAYYKPYTYPHPLAGGGVPPPTLSPPQNLRILAP